MAQYFLLNWDIPGGLPIHANKPVMHVAEFNNSALLNTFLNMVLVEAHDIFEKFSLMFK